jgi:hypothetical protein
MKELADHLGILLKEFTFYTLEQDGRFERSIRILMEKLRTAIINQDISEFLWPECLLAVIYITNLIANTALLDRKTPFKAF